MAAAQVWRFEPNTPSHPLPGFVPRPCSYAHPIASAIRRSNRRDVAASAGRRGVPPPGKAAPRPSLEGDCRSEEHTSELQSLMRHSYAVFCLKKKNDTHTTSAQG